VGEGGRYDDLIARFTQSIYPATGVSIGLDRLLYAIDQKKIEKIKDNNPVVICVFDKKQMPQYNKLLTLLRSSNINSEIYCGDGSLKVQMKYADKKNAPAVILYGDNEIKLGTVTIKNLKLGKEVSENVKTREDWTSSKTAQITAKVENLVNEIKKIL